MPFETFLPDERLAPFVKHFAIQELPEEAIYKVLPGTSLVMGFQYKGGISQVSSSEEKALSPYGITGIPDSYRYFKNRQSTGTVLVFFNEAGAARFFKEPLHEYYGQSVSLDNFVCPSQLSLLQEQLLEAGTAGEKIKVIQNFLVSRISVGTEDELIAQAVRHIQRQNGNIRVDQLVKDFHLSKSPFEKRFRRIIGTSPKKFASLVRFKFLLAQYHNSKSLTELSYNAGFYDQPHFIKEFRLLTGDTPETFFSSFK